MRHCPVTGEPIATCDCGSCGDDEDRAQEPEPYDGWAGAGFR